MPGRTRRGGRITTLAAGIGLASLAEGAREPLAFSPPRRWALCGGRHLGRVQAEEAVPIGRSALPLAWTGAAFRAAGRFQEGDASSFRRKRRGGNHNRSADWVACGGADPAPAVARAVRQVTVTLRPAFRAANPCPENIGAGAPWRKRDIIAARRIDNAGKAVASFRRASVNGADRRVDSGT